MGTRALGALAIALVLVACSGADAQEGPGSSLPGAADTTVPMFGGAHLTASGTGNAVVDLPDGNEAYVVRATFAGAGRFFVSVLLADGSEGAPVVIPRDGPYDGTQLIPPPVASATALSVGAEGEGEWTIELLEDADLDEVGTEFAGDGDAVLRYDGPAGVAHVTHDAGGTFYVMTAAGDRVVPYHVGVYDERVPWPGGPLVIQVTAGGEWTVEVVDGSK